MQSQRLLSCLLLLQGKPRATASELARQLEVSTRTIYRDVEALASAGVPIHMERGPLGGIVLADDYRRALAHFTLDEVRALFSSGPGPMGDLGLTGQNEALQKLAGALPEMQRKAAQTSRERLFLDHNKWGRGEQPTEILRRLRAACDGQRRVRLHYRDRDGAASGRDVDPLGLVAKAGVWYLIAREAGKGYRTFRVQRVESVAELGATFARPADFNLEEYWNASVLSVERQTQPAFEVVVRLSREHGARLSTYWKLAIRAEDADSVTLAVAFPSRSVASLELMLLACDLTILAPDDLASSIVASARAAIERFTPPGDR